MFLGKAYLSLRSCIDDLVNKKNKVFVIVGQ